MLSRAKKAMLTTLAALMVTPPGKVSRLKCVYTTRQSLAARQSPGGFHFTASRHRPTSSTREWMPSLR